VILQILASQVDRAAGMSHHTWLLS
jgi:hypothetical protein